MSERQSRRLDVCTIDATAQVFHHTLRRRTWRGPVGGGNPRPERHGRGSGRTT